MYQVLKKVFFTEARCLSDEASRSFEALFSRLDVNQDGKVDIAELRAGLAAMGFSLGEDAAQVQNKKQHWNYTGLHFQNLHVFIHCTCKLSVQWICPVISPSTLHYSSRSAFTSHEKKNWLHFYFRLKSQKCFLFLFFFCLLSQARRIIRPAKKSIKPALLFRMICFTVAVCSYSPHFIFHHKNASNAHFCCEIQSRLLMLAVQEGSQATSFQGKVAKQALESQGDVTNSFACRFFVRFVNELQINSREEVRCSLRILWNQVFNPMGINCVD